MSKKFLVMLKPLDWFFFGGERTHGEGQDSDYLSKSNRFPQQSAILGMLRYQILKQHNLLSVPGVAKTPTKITDINNLIGSESFNMSNRNLPADFKKIKKISPVCIAKEKTKGILSGYELFNPVPLDFGYENEILFVEVDNLYLNQDMKNKTRKIPKIVDVNEKFNHKTYNSYTKWQSQSEEIVSDDIWHSKMKIGITKHKEGDDNNEKNFYKQEYLFLKGNFVYTFFVDLEEDLQPDKVFIGGQRSVFDMKIIPVDKVECVHRLHRESILLDKKEGKIVLISDCFVESLECLNELCLFHWSDSIPFRNIETSTEKNNYYIKPKKSEVKYNFLKRGSVLYFEPDNRDKIEALLNNPYLQTIGYNIFI